MESLNINLPEPDAHPSKDLDGSEPEVSRHPFSWGGCFLSVLWLYFHSRPGWATILLLFNGLLFGLNYIVSGTGSVLCAGVVLIAVWVVQITLGINGSQIAMRSNGFQSISDLKRAERGWNIAGVVVAVLVDLPFTVLTLHNIFSPIVQMAIGTSYELETWTRVPVIRDILQFYQYAFLIGPFFTILLAVYWRWNRIHIDTAVLHAAYPLGLLSVTCTLSTNAVLYAAAFSHSPADKVEGGVAAVENCLAILRTNVHSLLAFSISTFIVLVIILVRRTPKTEKRDSPETKPSQFTLAILASFALAAIAVAWLLSVSQHMTDTTAIVIDPQKWPTLTPSTSDIHNIAESLSQGVRLLAGGGVILTLILMCISIVIVMTFRSRQQPDRFLRFSLLPILLLIAASGWASVRESTRIASFETLKRSLEQSAQIAHSPKSDPLAAVDVPENPELGLISGIPGAGAGDLGGAINGVPKSGIKRSSQKPIPVPRPIQAQRLLQKPDPVYPPLAKQARIEGIVTLALTIGTNGRVVEIGVTRGHPLLIPAAIDAGRQYRYRPALINGQPREVSTLVDVAFALPK